MRESTTYRGELDALALITFRTGDKDKMGEESNILPLSSSHEKFTKIYAIHWTLCMKYLLKFLISYARFQFVFGVSFLIRSIFIFTFGVKKTTASNGLLD